MSKYRIVSSNYITSPMFMVEEALYYKGEVIGYVPKINVSSLQKAEEYVEFYKNNKPVIYKEYE